MGGWRVRARTIYQPRRTTDIIPPLVDRQPASEVRTTSAIHDMTITSSVRRALAALVAHRPNRWDSLSRAFVAAVFLGAVPGAAGQGPRMAAPVLATSGSTRALGLGDAYTALGSDPDVIFYNPAQLVPARGIGLGVQRYERGSMLLNLSAASVLSPGTVGVGVQLLDQESSGASYPDFTTGGEVAHFDRGDAPASAAVVSLGYARPAFFNTRVGIAGKVIHQAFGSERDHTGAFDVGIARGSSVQLAVVGRNLGRGLLLEGSRVALPREVGFGAAIPRREVGPLDLAATVSAALLADGTWRGGGGTEWGYMPLDGFTFVARIGYRAVEGAESHLTLGAGFVGERVSLDYAVQASDGAGTVQRFGVRWR